MTAWTVAVVSWSFTTSLILLLVAQRGEIGYLRKQLEDRRDHERRIERSATGLPEEAPPQSQPDVPPPGLRTRIDQAIGAWESPETQRQKWQDVNQWRAENREWEWIAHELESEILDE